MQGTGSNPRLPKIGAESKLQVLYGECMPNPPVSGTVRFLSMENVPEAINSMCDSIRVKQ